MIPISVQYHPLLPRSNSGRQAPNSQRSATSQRPPPPPAPRLAIPDRPPHSPRQKSKGLLSGTDVGICSLFSVISRIPPCLSSLSQVKLAVTSCFPLFPRRIPPVRLLTIQFHNNIAITDRIPLEYCMVRAII